MDKFVGNYAVLDNGTTWPLPRSEDDIIWRISWAPESVTQQDLHRLASIASSYQFIIECMSQKERNFTCSKIKGVMEMKDSGNT